MQLLWFTIGIQIYTMIQVVHAKSTKVVLTGYSAFMSSRKMIQEQMQQVIIALTSEKKNKKKRIKRRACVKHWLKRRKNLEFYETLLAELLLEEYN